MHVSFLSLTSWRNHTHSQVELVPGVSVFLGPNGQGKTNLIEAIGYLSTLDSHRVSSPQQLIQAGASSALIRAKLLDRDREVRLELQLNRDRPNQAQLAGTPTKPRELTRYCHSVLFAPEDLDIVRGDPGERRRYLDGLLMQLTPRLAGVLADYERVLRQRGQLLKTARGNAALSTLEIWNHKLSELGAEIVHARLRLIDALTAPLRAAYRQIVDADHAPGMRLDCSWSSVLEDSPLSAAVSTSDIRAQFEQAMALVASRELERGVNLVGPHRDDLHLELNGLPVKGYASHGESWSFVLALKLAAAEVLRADSLVGDPVLILDDVFAELDSARRLRLARAVAAFEQVLITAAVPEDVPAELQARHFRVSAGTVVAEAVA